jgi:hypothetical protein
VSWNYRVIRRTVADEDAYAIHEVYHTDGEPKSCSVNPVYPQGETLDELVEDSRKYGNALSKPVLNYEDFQGVTR